jgi:hypothetical protein
MFEDSFLVNAAIFAAGQAVAWAYLHTGRTRRGVVLMLAGWVLADVALLARFAYDGALPVYVIALSAMQAWSIAELLLFTFARLRRRFGRFRRERERLYRLAFVHYLRNELPAAGGIWRRLVRRDPWDMQSTLALATVHARLGRRRRARGLFRAARALDRDGRLRDVIRDELKRFAARRQRGSRR